MESEASPRASRIGARSESSRDDWHAMRAGLSEVMGFAELLSQGMFGALTAEQTELLRRIVRSSRRVLQVVNTRQDREQSGL